MVARFLALGEPPATRPRTLATHAYGIRTDVEALRGVAILLVVAYHCHVPATPGGFIGVDVFYVLSGYLITGLLTTEIERTSRLSLLQFYARRVRRLLPASSLVVLVTLVVGALTLAPQELNLTSRTARANALYVSNLFFLQSSSDYFSPRNTFNPLLHTWSLAVEEQFYLIWPCLIALGLVVWRSRRGLAGLMLILTVVSLACCVWFTEHHRVFAFYALPTRAWEFGLGGLASLLPRGSLKLSANTWLAVGWLGASLICGSSLLLTPAMPFPGSIALLPVVGTTLTLISGAEQPHRGIGAWFEVAPLQKLGALSYSWYLWHWPFLVFTAALIPRSTTSARVLAAGAALAIAYLTYRYFEDPIRRDPYLVKHARLSLAAGAAIAVASLGAALIALRIANHLSEAPRMQALAAARADFADMSRKECVSVDGSSAVKICEFGSPISTTNIVLFGDSHAAQWFDALHEMAQRQHWRLTTVVKLGCAAVDTNPGRGIDDDSECSAWRAEALHRIVALHPSLVIMGNATNKLGRPENPGVLASPELLSAVRDGVLRTIRPLSKAGLRLVLMRDTPEFPFDVTSCLARVARLAWYPRSACELPLAAVLDPAVFAAEKSAALGLSNVSFIDLTDQLCPANVCKTTLDGLVMYRDTHHLTGTSAIHLISTLEPQVLRALGLPNSARIERGHRARERHG
jgi:peptidoglycan/LPS O-acetylase OafA/YrhL